MTIEINQLLKELISELEIKFKDNFTGLVLFGSYARGTQKKHSDVDILLTFKDIPESTRKQFALIRDEIMQLENKYSIEINPVMIKEKKLGKSSLIVDIAEYATIIIDKNNIISKLFANIKKEYEIGLYQKISKGDYYILKIENV